MIAALWSDDEKFYETLFATTEAVGSIFVKVDPINLELIINKYNLKEIKPNIFTNTNEYNYICIISHEKQKAIELIQQTIQQIQN
jgi:GTP-binding protein EngB required for normal cell division